MFLQQINNNDTVSTPFEYDFVLSDYTETPPFKTLDFHENISNSSIVILHSSNGLMLCYSLHISKEPEFSAAYYVYSPTKKQVATLPIET